MTYLILAAIAWIACGVASYGMGVARRQSLYTAPINQPRGIQRLPAHRMMAFVEALLGPMGLALIWADGWRPSDGWRL